MKQQRKHSTNQYRAVFFDMDGTVLDTLQDLTTAINYALMQTGHQHAYPEETMKYFVGSGIYVAIRRALELEAIPLLEPRELIAISDTSDMKDEIERVRLIFQPFYEKHCNDHTRPYPGILDLLLNLKARSIRTAVISNKPDAAVQILTEHLFPNMFEAAAGEKTDVARKPAPDLILHLLDEMQIAASETLYVGDSEIDLQTAENAGMDCAAVTWGFRGRAYLEQLLPTYLMDTCEELEELIIKGTTN